MYWLKTTSLTTSCHESTTVSIIIFDKCSGEMSDQEPTTPWLVGHDLTSSNRQLNDWPLQCFEQKMADGRRLLSSLHHVP